MGSVYLVWLADELRATGLRVVECDGWQTRARSSGGYESGRPWCVMAHHTASRAGCSAANDVGYMLSQNNPAYPTANLYVSRDGEVWVMAAGATNTNGKGSGERRTSKGTVPVDSMNTYAVGIEIGNNGTGEPYSRECIDAFFTTSLVVTNKLGLRPTDVIHHQAYAPDRKVDPANASGVQGAFTPRPVTSAGTWSLDDLKAECLIRASEENDMPLSDEDIARIWAHKLNDGSGGEQSAGWFLTRAQGIVRRYLGAPSGRPPPDETTLERIDKNTRT